jgi:uncharacterized protein YhaN
MGLSTTKSETGAACVESLLIKQHELFDRLDALSQRQATLIRADETDRLLHLLGERQEVIDQIAKTNAGLEPYKARWEAFMQELPLPNRERVRKRLDAVAHLADVIAQRDETDRRELQQRRDAMAGELSKISNARGAMAAYGNGGVMTAPKYQDREA